MATGTDVSPQIPRWDGGCNASKGGLPAMEDANDENSTQSKTGKPPRSLSCIRHCSSTTAFLTDNELDIGIISLKSPSIENSGFLPIFRSGSWSEKGPKQYMEDEYISVDNLCQHLATAANCPAPAAFYGVFDGHGGIDAASFARNNLLNFIVEDPQFPSRIKKAIKSAFVKTDHALADAKSVDSFCGTTALTALILGRNMLIANAGDSRAVLGKRGRAIELSKDHKPSCTSERLRIERLGGVIYDGYLNGQLAVARALGDWHIKGSKGAKSPLSAEPELEEMNLTEEDEFLIMGCDGLWDVMSSQCAVTIVRKELMTHNDPERCSKALVKEALQRNTCDNLTVVVACFSPEPPPKIEIQKYQRRRSISAEGLDRLKGVLSTAISTRAAYIPQT